MGEFARIPLDIHWHCLSANFYSRAAALPNDRLVHRALLEAFHLEEQGHPTGLSALTRYLSGIGIQATTLADLAAIRPRSVRKAAEQHWKALWQQQLSAAATDTRRHSQSSAYFSIVPTFPTKAQPYISNSDITRHQRSTFTRLRCGNHWLAEHTSRYAKAAEKQRELRMPCHCCGLPTPSVSNPFLFCDSCNQGWHCQCLTPPLSQVPPDEYWYCPSCTTADRCHPHAREAQAARIAHAAKCPHCTSPTEDVAHFLFTCPFYSSVRNKFQDLFPPHITTPFLWFRQTKVKRMSLFVFECYQFHKTSLTDAVP